MQSQAASKVFRRVAVDVMKRSRATFRCEVPPRTTSWDTESGPLRFCEVWRANTAATSLRACAGGTAGLVLVVIV